MFDGDVMRRRTSMLLAIGGVLLLLYVGWYVGLSRRGYAEADARKFKGFYYLAPEDTDAWEYKNYGCAGVFWPLNIADRAIGFGREPASEPLVGGLSSGGKK
jgi:hypothetical protein